VIDRAPRSRSYRETLALPDHLLLYPAHYSGSVCGRGLSGHPTSTIGFELRHNTALRFNSEDEFVAALVGEIRPGKGEMFEGIRLRRASSRS
jgi:hydroxyacylglutathione hydrolase